MKKLNLFIVSALATIMFLGCGSSAAVLSTPIENRDYLLTSGFSAADISVGQAVYMARHFAKTDAHPALAAWYERITDRASFKDA